MQTTASWALKLSALVILMFFQSKGVLACSIFPSMEATENHFRRMIERSDYVFVGTVNHILRRRWSEDDEKPYFSKTWLDIAARANAGEDVGRDDHIANWVNYAEATAFLRIELELYWTGLKTPYSRGTVQEFVPIDMLRPFSAFGRGPCFSFPRTCPWSIKSGSTVVLAMKETRFGPNKVLFCREIPRLTRSARNEIQNNNKYLSRYEAILPYIKRNRR